MNIRPKDICTIPNAISAIGFGLVVDGARKIDEPAGFAKVAAGRTLDLVDGAVARATGQTSELGAAVDASLDKLGGLAVLIAEWRKGIAPKPAIAGIFVQNLANGVATTMAARNHPDQELAPSRVGKYAMFTQNLAVCAYTGGNLLKGSHPRIADTLRNMGHAATVVGVGVLGAKATYGYFKRVQH